MTTPEPPSIPTAKPRVDFYDATYGKFNESLYRDIRRQTWHEDFGQNGWITAGEQDQFIEWLSLRPGQRLLDIACGSGGPTLRIAERTGADVVGVDIHPDAVNAAQHEANRRGLGDRASFQALDASSSLPFDDRTFDAIICIDAINHLNHRAAVLADWARTLKPGGRLLFTDPAVVTGPVANEELALRASIGFFLFVAPTTNDGAIADAGLRLITKTDVSEALATIAAKWRAARQDHAAALQALEGAETFDGQQRFLEASARLARERRLSRFEYRASKP